MAEFALETGATHIVRSLTVAMDFDYELPDDAYESLSCTGCADIYFPAEQEDTHLNSTTIRELLRLGKILPRFIPGELIS